jgi:hypothetical protein
MAWILFAILQITVIVSGIRQEQRTGQWSWSKFVFTLGFAGLELLIVFAPLYYFGLNSRYFIPTFIAAWVIALLNFIWFIIVCRRWKLPDGRTSLQAYRDEHKK